MKEMYLKPCPFCGGKSVMHGELGWLSTDTQWYWVRCKECDSMIPAYTTEEQAAEAWNGRKNLNPAVGIQEKALLYLYKQLKKARIDLGIAEYKGVADEITNLQTKIEVLEWLTSIAVKEVQ